MDQPSSTTDMKSDETRQKLSTQPWGVIWRTGLAKLPRLAPTQALYITNPKGPYPHVIKLPSRNPGRNIPCFAFVPPQVIDADLGARHPIVVDFHGGGFFLGTCLEEAPFCGKLARDLGAVVITIDYRMGPVHRFPAAQEDAEDVMYAILRENSRGHRELRQAITTHILERRQRAYIKTLSKDEKHAYERRKPSPLELRRKGEPDLIDLDIARIAVAGASSGGNIALNLALDVDPPLLDTSWPGVFPRDYPNPIAFLLYFPSFDARQLPSERTRPEKMPVSKGVWAEMNDMLMPTYLPREQAGHPRASPGLASVRDGLHPQARMQLILCEIDNLAEQSEEWVAKVQREGRGDDLIVERYEGMKHGWTHIPEMALSAREKETRNDAIEKSVEFTRRVWAGQSIHFSEVNKST